jgi:hypothetical protein
MLLVGGTQYFTLVWPGGAHQPFVVHTGDHILHLSITIPVPHLRIKRLKARRQNDRRYSHLYSLRRLTEIDGLILTDSFANTTLLLLQVETVFVNVGDQGNGLSEIDMDGFVLRYSLIELIRVLDRAVFYTGRAAPALVLQDIPGLLGQSYLEVPCFALYTVNVSVGEDFYVGMPADLDQFGRKYSDGAVVGGKGLVQLGHVAANGRCLVDQVNPKARIGKIKRRLDPADAPADNHYITKTTARQTSTKLCNAFS